MSENVVPTINDLRVKICYICREEEFYDNPEVPRRAWTHPCKCTLIAHETCLLEWLRSAQNRSSSAGRNALKCPQCGTLYEISSDNPFILRLLKRGNQLLNGTGTVFTVAGAVSGLGLVSSVCIWMLTKYGVFAVREFFGEEMFQLQLTDDISNWPFVAFINLPLIPLSLIYSRFGRHDLLPLVNVLLNVTSGIRYPISFQDNNRLTQTATNLDPSDSDTLPLWPPTPLMFSVLIFPLTRIVYRRYHQRLRQWVLRGSPALRNPAAEPEQLAAQEPVNDAPAQAADGGFQLQIFVNADAEAEQNDVVADADPEPAVEPLPPAAQGGNVDVPAEENIEAENAPAPEALLEDNQNLAAAAPAAAPAPVAPAPAPAVAAAPAAAARPARRPIEIDASFIGRRVLGALLIPSISSVMGNLLLKLSEKLPLLRKFLAVKPKWNGPWPIPVARRELTFKHFLRVFVGGVGPLPRLDPVWWRNSVGFGLFVMITDCLELFHLWLTRRELQTRKVKNKDFSGIDINALDLIPGWHRVDV